MNIDIKYCVEKCQISEKRNSHENAKIKMFQLDRKMANMKFNRQIGLYAFKLDRYEYLLQILNTLPINKQAAIKTELSRLQDEINEMESNRDIREYKCLRDEYTVLKESLSDYPKSINIALRNELKHLELPDIYIYTEDREVSIYHHIIQDNRYILIIPELSKGKNTVIYPIYEMHSNRDYRHFYNKISFKYLEELSKDYTFDIQEKQLKKLKVKKM